MNMDSFFAHTQELRDYLKEFLQSEKLKASSFVWSEDVFSRLINFSQSGKAVRGNSILLLAQYNPGIQIRDVLPIAAAIELFHTSILFQDDVMDKDLRRRGKESLHAQYSKIVPNMHIAESFAYGIGDIGFFLSFSLINKAQLSDQRKQEIVTLFSDELVKVGLGQLQDVYVPNGIPTVDIVLQTYLTKTARYTFSLPFLLGSICGDVPNSLRKKIDAFGEHVGIIFQLQDDTIGLFGTEEEIGKPIGSDIREGKYTLHILSLLDKVTEKEKQHLSIILGNKQASPDDIIFVLDLMKTYEIQKDIHSRMDDEAKKAMSLLDAEVMATSFGPMLEKLLIYNLKRTN